MNENEKLTDVETDDLDAEIGTDDNGQDDDVDVAATENDDLTDEETEDSAEDDSDEDEDDFSEDDEDDDSDDDDSDDDDSDDDDSDTDDAPAAKEPSAEARRIAELEAKLKKYELHGRRALKQLGVGSDDVLSGLEKFNADSEGKTIEDLRAEVDKQSAEDAERAELDAYKRQKAQLAFEKKALADLEAIQSEYPETRKYKHFSEMPNSKRYAELMATGKMSPVEAYIASHPKEARQGAAAAAKQQSLNDTKRHIKSNVPKNGGSGDKSYISKSEMKRYRETFHDLSDEEIKSLYKRVTR